MDIAYGRFASEAISVIQDIAESHFIAFDLEFSGIGGPTQQRSPGKPSLQELYDDTRVAAARYQILQVGLTVVKEDVANGRYIVKPYNFNISPLPTLRERQFSRDWTMSSGAVQFLLRNKFDFSLPLTHGIPYLSRAEEVQARMTMSGENDKRRPDMVLKPDDENLVKHIRTSIATWQKQPEEERENYLNIPNDDRGKGVPGVLNRYQVRLTHQIVQNEFPQLKTTSMQHFVQITNPSQEEKDRLKLLQTQHIDREIGRAIGFRWILEAMMGRDVSGMPDEIFLAAAAQFGTAKNGLTPFQNFIADLNEKLNRRRKVLIGHNCLTDLVYLHQFLLGQLPDRVEDFQDSIHDIFPAIVDTKHMASFGNGRWGDTSLEAVEDDLRTETDPSIFIPPEFDRYALNERPHEAGYDALLTATIAIKLSAKMEREAIYYDQDTPKGAAEQQEQAPTESFGTKEEGYVTASEDLEYGTADTSTAEETRKSTPTPQTSDKANKADPTAITSVDLVSNTTSASTTETSAPISPNPEPTTSAGTTSSSTLIAIKERKPKPKPKAINPTKLVQNLRPSSFAAPNIYDILDPSTSASSTSSENEEEDLLSFSDPDSPVRCKTLTPSEIHRSRIEELMKQGKLMPRWDGGNGFWQMFGNKLQVNSCKEGVCKL